METTKEKLELQEGINHFIDGSQVTIYFNGEYKVSVFANDLTLHSDKDLITVNGTSMFIHDISNYKVSKTGTCIPTIDIYIN